MKSRSRVGSRLAHCELAKKNLPLIQSGGKTRVYLGLAVVKTPYNNFKVKGEVFFYIYISVGV